MKFRLYNFYNWRYGCQRELGERGDLITSTEHAMRAELQYYQARVPSLEVDVHTATDAAHRDEVALSEAKCALPEGYIPITEQARFQPRMRMHQNCEENQIRTDGTTKNALLQKSESPGSCASERLDYLSSDDPSGCITAGGCAQRKKCALDR